MKQNGLSELARSMNIGFAAFGSLGAYERLLALASKRIDSPKGAITEVMADCQAMIVFGMAYSLEPKVTECPDGMGWISPMAYGYDYHGLIRQKGDELVAALEKTGIEGMGDFQSLEGTVCVDTSPINDRLAALSAEGAFVTTNGAVALDGIGAACHVGILLLTATNEKTRNVLADLDSESESKWLERRDEHVDADGPWQAIQNRLMHPNCKNCGSCVRVCPGGAIRYDGPILRERCLSYISQSKEALTPEMAVLLGNRLYGCDDCQTCCPINMDRDRTSSSERQMGGTRCEARSNVNFLPLDHMETISNKDFKSQYGQMGFAWRGAGIIRRNAAIVRKNQKV